MTARHIFWVSRHIIYHAKMCWQLAIVWVGGGKLGRGPLSSSTTSGSLAPHLVKGGETLPTLSSIKASIHQSRSFSEAFPREPQIPGRLGASRGLRWPCLHSLSSSGPEVCVSAHLLGTFRGSHRALSIARTLVAAHRLGPGLSLCFFFSGWALARIGANQPFSPFCIGVLASCTNLAQVGHDTMTSRLPSF